MPDKAIGSGIEAASRIIDTGTLGALLVLSVVLNIALLILLLKSWKQCGDQTLAASKSESDLRDRLHAESKAEGKETSREFTRILTEGAAANAERGRLMSSMADTLKKLVTGFDMLSNMINNFIERLRDRLDGMEKGQEKILSQLEEIRLEQIRLTGKHPPEGNKGTVP